jgi:hypothetical protein
MRRSYVVAMRWMVIYEYGVPGGALNLNSTKLPRPWSPWGSSPSRKNPHGRTGNRTRDLMISSQKLWPLDHEADHQPSCLNVKLGQHGITVFYWLVLERVLLNIKCYIQQWMCYGWHKNNKVTKDKENDMHQIALCNQITSILHFC